ncbi:LOW QUALITY PROTEIN: uncharacterized protein LOC117316398 [Pecten maximus]|uniref:LOW QUALITY PROTEIN: uncharacterized protein LOC117316398 n=1 Tax=Pecten maximus TaxID=6579 RepID=UPI001457FB65|nr:LOW QUALITY PROTEIN: uncharacterized protein LOC117316398 [Pecten maximus]
MADDRKSQAGFFSLCLNTARNPSTKHLDYRIAVAEKLLKDFSSLHMSKNAILNLKGIFMFYRRDQLKTAIACFQKVLETSDKNKNAIAHLISVYQRLHINSKAKWYKEMQERFEEQRKKRGALSDKCEYSVGGKSGEDNFEILFEYYDAEALAEQGIAFFHDCYTEEDEWNRSYRSLKLFVDSLELIKNVKIHRLGQETLKEVEHLELEVKYWLGQCYQKVHQGVCRRDYAVKQPCCKDSYREGIQCLRDITRSELAVEDLKAWAWAYLGVFFFKKPKDQGNIDQYIHDQGLKEEFNDPKICFERALQLETQDCRSTETRIRYATYLRTLKDPMKLEEAIRFLNDAWELCKTDGNWFAKTMLAQVSMNMYNLLKTKAAASKVDPEQESERKSCAEFLDNCHKIWEEALVMNTTAMDLANVAEAYYLRGLKSDGTIDADSDDAMNAAEYFWQAVQCLGTEKKPEIHKKHGVFLKAMGEDRQAIECFKRGMEVDIPNRPPDNFDQLFNTFLQMYSKERKDDKVEQDTDDDHQRSTGQTDQEVLSGNRSNNRTPGEEESPKDTADGNEPLQNVSSSESGIMNDLELDGSVSTKLTTEPLDITSNTNKESKQPQKTWSYKQNMVLYEMAYWYQYATRHYRPNALTKYTKKYVKEFQEEMSMMHAYLELETNKENRNAGPLSVLEDVVRSGESLESEIQEAYREKVKHAKQLLTRKMKEEEEKTEQQASHCTQCSRPYSEPFARQNSVIPELVLQPRNTYYKYDFYVIFNCSERDWVYYSLLQKLEKSYRFKGAIPERDYRLGHSNFAEMERCIKESLKVLIILSSNISVREETKSMYEINFALTLHQDLARGHYIIPVLKDDNCLPPRQLDTLTCVNAVQSNAWEKIVLALECK